MKRWFFMFVLQWLLTGCVLDTFELPASYSPKHSNAAAPLADGAVFHGQLDPEKGGEIYMRFVRTGTASYVMEQLALPDRDEGVMLPAHVRFVPLDARHYAMHWRYLGNPKQGYALVRFESGRMMVLVPPRDQAAFSRLVERYGISARSLALGGYGLDTTDEGRLLGFFAALVTRTDMQIKVYAGAPGVPPAPRDAALMKLGEHIPQLTRQQLGDDATASEVVAWARTLAGEAHGAGHYLYARLAMNGWGMAADRALGVREAEAAVRRGVPQAEHVVAVAHYYGLGVPADPVRAYPHARRAADAGSPAGMSLVGLAYREGQGVRQDKLEARRWFRRAADAGHPPAHALWASLVLDDATEAGDQAARGAVDAGIATDDTFAHFLRGWMHENGRAGPKDLVAATVMFIAAADRGDAYSKYLAGHRLRHGQHVAQDIPRGRALLAEAAQAGVVEAKDALAQPDPAPAKKGCEEDWCKRALAVTEAHLAEQKARLRALRAELRVCPEITNPTLSCAELGTPPAGSVSSDGAMRVVSFFMYDCVKCAESNAFLKQWSEQRRVFLYRVPAIFGTARSREMARIHLAFKTLGVADALDRKAYEAVAAKRLQGRGVDEFVSFAQGNGLSMDQARAAHNDPGMIEALGNAEYATHHYKIAAVPAVFVNGRYVIELRATDARTLADLGELLDELVAQERLLKR